MDGLPKLLETVHSHGLVKGYVRGLFHILIGRRITAADGTVISTGVTWRELSVLLKDERFEKELVEEVGGDPEELSPRDRQRFWYSAIALAQPDSVEAANQAEKLIPQLKKLGYTVGPPPAPPRPAPRVSPSRETSQGESKSPIPPKKKKK